MYQVSNSNEVIIIIIVVWIYFKIFKPSFETPTFELGETKPLDLFPIEKKVGVFFRSLSFSPFRMQSNLKTTNLDRSSKKLISRCAIFWG